MRRLATVVVSMLAAVGLFAGQIAQLAQAAPAGSAASLSMSDAEKQDAYLDVLTRFVPRAEAFWRTSDLADPNTDYFAASGPGVTQPRGGGNMSYVYATLLTARPEQQSFGGVSRQTMLDHAIGSIRHEALTNKLSGASYKRWGDGTWQAALETYSWGFAAHLLADDLDEETTALVKRVVAAEADILITKPPASGVNGDTGAEDNGWNTPVLTLATIMMPDHPHLSDWKEATSRHAINASSTEADKDSNEIVDGKPVSEWMSSVNLHPDLTIENHGFFNPIYQQVTHANLADAAVMLAEADQPIPEALSFRTGEIWDTVLAPLVADDGDIIMTAGQDWTSKDYQHLLYLSTLATRFKRADASVAESRALELVVKRQATHDNGAILNQPTLGYESMLVKRMASAYWNHHEFGPSPQPTSAEYSEARDASAGTREFPFVDTVLARRENGFTSMSWSKARPMGLVVPGAEQNHDDPILAAYATRSLIGSATGAVGEHTCDCREDFFSTAGTIGDRDFSMTSFADGLTMLLDRGTGSTFNLALERIAGLTGDRPVTSAGNEGMGDLSGNWLNVADRLGMVAIGGGGMTVSQVGAANPYTLVEGARSTGTGNRGSVILPATTSAVTADVADSVAQPATPDGWSSLYTRASDHTGRFVIGRWSGDSSATVKLSDDRGAPVTGVTSTLDGTTATTRRALATAASTGETIHFFVDTDGPLQATGTDDRQIRLTNNGDDAVHAAIVRAGSDGTQQDARVTVEPGQQISARIIAGKIVTSGEENELLTSAVESLDAFAVSIRQWRDSGALDGLSALKLLLTQQVASSSIREAQRELKRETPRAAVVKVRVEIAERVVRQLTVRRASPEITQHVDDTRTSVLDLLDRVLGNQLTLTAQATTSASFVPGETARLRVRIENRDLAAARNITIKPKVPAGWSVSPTTITVPSLSPGASKVLTADVAVPVSAQSGDEVALGADITYRVLGHERSASATVDATVASALVIEPAAGSLPLADGGWNRAEVKVKNVTDVPTQVKLSATAPAGIEVDIPSEPLQVAPGETATGVIELRNNGLSTGDSAVQIVATNDRGVEARAEITARHSTNLGFNPSNSTWPAAFASNNQATYPPQLAFDGNPSTFWVPSSTNASNGPAPSRPVDLGVDFGAKVVVGKVTMLPRPNYGPKVYTIDVSDNGDDWTTVATVDSAPNAETTSTFDQVATRHIRIRITGGWDARTAQVRELAVAAQ